MLHYRLYVDESGDHTYSFAHDPDARYLGLTGVLIENEYYRDEIYPGFEALKQTHFPHSPDDPLVLARSQIIHRRGLFRRLIDPDRNARWERGLIDFLSNMRATLFTVVIDKQNHLAQYGHAAYHPYHYCFSVMLERLRGHLLYSGGRADVMAESRGGREDQELKRAYNVVWSMGTRFISAEEFQKVFSSNDIKLRKKDRNIAGLQIADLVAAPAKLDILAAHNRSVTVPMSRYTRQINLQIRQKFNPYGRVFLD